jgi:hypothetical protein
VRLLAIRSQAFQAGQQRDVHHAALEIDLSDDVLDSRQQQLTAFGLNDIDIIAAGRQDFGNRSEQPPLAILDPQTLDLVPEVLARGELNRGLERHRDKRPTLRLGSRAVINTFELEDHSTGLQPTSLESARDRRITDQDLTGGLEALREVGKDLAEQIAVQAMRPNHASDSECQRLC